MDTRLLGSTGIRVSVLGFGAIPLGDTALTEHEAGDLLNRVLDAGITLIDAARSYGLAEERIGRHLADRRSEFVLSTKVGYGVEGCHDWTHECVARGVDTALQRMRTDHIDIVHLHSCPVEVLEHNGVLEALDDATAAGKIGAVAYSGDNEPLDWTILGGRVGSIQTSINLCDQGFLDRTGPAAATRGIGVLAKRVLANAPWRAETGRETSEESEYRRRFNLLRQDWPEVEDWPSAALRFAAYAPGVACALIGTANPRHLASNVQAAELGPLPQELTDGFRHAWQSHGQDWRGIV